MAVANSPVRIRLGTPADAPAVANVLHESFVEYESLYTPQGFAATTLDVQRILARMQEGPLWIALRNADVLGTIAAVVKAESIYIRGMAVSPHARRLKVGALLLEQAERFAAEQHCARIFLSTTPFLEAAIRFYEQFGFRRVEGSYHDLFGTPLFTMEKHIPS
jgi:ribosomal protein S18 acetylase RimI-like enzyme